MPSFDRSLNVYQGFNFNKDKQDKVGFLTALTIGSEALAVDLSCKEPTSPTTVLKAVAVLDNFSWGTGITDSIYLTGRISLSNKQKVAELLLGTLTDTTVLFNFEVYEYDQLAKKYFKSSYPNEELKGLLEKSGDNLNLRISEDPSSDVQSPLNFQLQLGIKAQETEQTINLATGDQKVITKAWGLTVEA